MKEKDRVAILYLDVDRSMAEDYPELKDVSEFRGLTSYELRFAWLIGVFYNVDITKRVDKLNLDRVRMAIEMAFHVGNRWILNKTDQYNYLQLKFPDRIRRAILKFRNFDTPSRFKAKMFIDNALDNLERFSEYEDAYIKREIINEKGEKEIITEINYDHRKKYSDYVINIIKELPELIKIKESGFGLREVDFNGDDFINPPLDLWHEKMKSK